MGTLEQINASLEAFDSMNKDLVEQGKAPLEDSKLIKDMRFRKKHLESQSSGIPASPAPVVSGEISMETGNGKRKKRGSKRGLYVKKQGSSGAPVHTASGLNL